MQTNFRDRLRARLKRSIKLKSNTQIRMGLSKDVEWLTSMLQPGKGRSRTENDSNGHQKSGDDGAIIEGRVSSDSFESDPWVRGVVEDARLEVEIAIESANGERLNAAGAATPPSSSHASADDFLSVSNRFVERRHEAPNNSAWLCAAIIAVEETITSLPQGHPSLVENLIWLSELYHTRSKWKRPSSRGLADIGYAIEPRKEILAMQSLSELTRVESLRKLSALYEDRFELTRNENDLKVSIEELEQALALLTGSEWGRLEASLSALKLKDHNTAGDIVLEVPFNRISTAKISHDNVPRRRYRFLDCRAFAARKALRVLQFNHLPADRYVAVSYIWRGIGAISPSSDCVSIIGAENADSISIEVLRIACAASLALRCELLWLDGLCIIQDDDADKSWQIENMYKIYELCRECLVIPGGLSRLACLDEETAWIHRAWTLQEAVAPKSAMILFSWTEGDCGLQTHFYVPIKEIEAGVAAVASMKNLIEISGKICTVQFLEGVNSPLAGSKIRVKIMGDPERDFVQQDALVGALDLKGNAGMANAIWRSAIMRTASRPVDMIFSIMGLLGVTLDTSKYSPYDRHEATLALMKATLKKGGIPEWLGIAPRVEPSLQLSTMPIIPKSSAAGRAILDTKDGEKDASDVMGFMFWWLSGIPTGSIDAEGCLTIEVQAAALRLNKDNGSSTSFKSYSNQSWEVIPGGDGPPYGAQIGTQERYLNGSQGWMWDPDRYLLMLLDQNDHGHFWCIGYASVRKEVIESEGWFLKTVRIR